MNSSALVVTLLILPTLCASGTGVLSFTNPLPAARDSVGSTQLVQLIQSGAFLIGKPRGASVVSIIAVAPGIRTQRLLLRERRLGFAHTLIQIVAPTSVERKLQRVTLFLRPEQGPLRVFQKDRGTWNEPGFQRFVTSDTAPQSAIGVVLNNLGLLCLLSGEPDAGSSAIALPPPEFGDFDADVRGERLRWHLIWPSVALAIFFIASRLLYSTYTLSGK